VVIHEFTGEAALRDVQLSNETGLIPGFFRLRLVDVHQFSSLLSLRRLSTCPWYDFPPVLFTFCFVFRLVLLFCGVGVEPCFGGRIP